MLKDQITEIHQSINLEQKQIWERISYLDITQTSHKVQLDNNISNLVKLEG